MPIAVDFAVDSSFQLSKKLIETNGTLSDGKIYQSENCCFVFDRMSQSLSWVCGNVAFARAMKNSTCAQRIVKRNKGSVKCF